MLQGTSYSVMFITMPDLAQLYDTSIGILSLTYVAETSGRITTAVLLGSKYNHKEVTFLALLYKLYNLPGGWLKMTNPHLHFFIALLVLGLTTCAYPVMGQVEPLFLWAYLEGFCFHLIGTGVELQFLDMFSLNVLIYT